MNTHCYVSSDDHIDSVRSMSLPLLPGYPNASPSNKSLGKTRHFEFKNGIPVAKQHAVELTPDEITALETLSFSPSKAASPARVVLPPVIPAHVALDKKVAKPADGPAHAFKSCSRCLCSTHTSSRPCTSRRRSSTACATSRFVFFNADKSHEASR